MRMAAELFVPPRSDDGDESIGAFITRRFGREATEYLAEPLLAGIHAGDVDRLSIHALFPRFADAERTSGSLLRAFRQPQQRHGRAGQEESDGAFRSLSGGLDEMIRALVAKLPANSIRLSTPVCRITRRDAFQIETEDGLLQARAVVLATPAFVTARLVRSLSGVLANLCDEIPYASTATVALAFRRTSVTHPLKGSGFVVPRTERTGILAASWLSSKWPNRAPDHSVLLRAFVGGARDPQGLARSDPELVTLALNALGPLLGITGPPILTRVYRWETRQRAARSGSSDAARSHQADTRGSSRAVPQRQRLSRRRHSRLRGRRPRHSKTAFRMARRCRPRVGRVGESPRAGKAVGHVGQVARKQ